MPFLSGVNTNSSYTSKGLPATYSITQDVLSAKEGQSVVFTITTTNVRDGAKLFWTTSGNVAGADFVGSALTGNVTVINNSATVTRTITLDGLADPGESFSIVVRTSSVTGKVVATSAAVTISPSITITPNVTTISEGSTITFTIVGNDLVNPAMTVYWSIVPVSGVFDAADMTAAFTGSSVLSNSTATFSRVLTNDALTEPTVESFRADLYSDVSRTILMASSAVVTVTDTSKTVGYSITASTTSVNEGTAVTFNVVTENLSDTTLYWTLSGNSTVVAADFSDSAISGSFAITNNAGSFTRTMVSDLALEGPEQFNVFIRTISTGGPLVLTSDTIIVNDTSVPTYTITPSASSVNEGSAVSFTVNTTGVANGTVLYWNTNAVSGTVDASDFSDALLIGTVTINTNTGSLSRTLTSDLTTEGIEAFQIRLYRDSGRINLVATSSTVTINDTSLTRTYAIAPGVTSVNEGSAVTFTVTTANVGSGTLYWDTLGTMAAADFTGAVLTGSVTITANSGTISRTLASDLTLEGTETFALRLYTDIARTVLVATSANVTVNDTSVPTYSIAPSASSVNEGSAVTFTVTTAGIANGTVLYWNTNAVSGTVDASDFSDALLIGTVTINSSTGSISRTLVADITTEGIETFQLRLYTDSGRTNLVATSTTVTINDTSLTRTYAIAPNITSVNEGSAVTFTVTTTNFGSGTLYWDTSGTMTAADFTGAVLNGSVTVTTNSGTISRTLSADVTTEGAETFALRLYTDVARTVLVATSATVTVNDTSLAPTYSISQDTTTVSEGGSVIYTVTTANVANGTTLYWNTTVVSGTVDVNDFTSASISGSFTINTNTGSITRTLTADTSTEGGESFQLTIRTASITGTVVATSNVTTINDTSLTQVWSVTPNVASVNEGGAVVFNITATNTPNGTYYWTTAGTTVAADFSDATVSGTFTLTSGAGTVTRTLANDLVTEGAQTLTLSARITSISGTIKATSSSVTVNDTSLTPPGQTLYTTTQIGSATFQTYSWVVPAGVSSISVVCIGGGGGGASGTTQWGAGGGGGALAYSNNLAVTAGETITVRVGSGGTGFNINTTTASNTGGTSSILRGAVVLTSAAGGTGGFTIGAATTTRQGRGGTSVVSTGAGWPGGNAGNVQNVSGAGISGAGGAAGYNGGGGSGGSLMTSASPVNATASTGGGGGGGGYKSWIVAGSRGGRGGNVGALGLGANGAAGTNMTTTGVNTAAGDGGDGSGGGYGGGGSGGYNVTTLTLLHGTPGAVRIMWPGTARSYPSTRVASE